MDLNYATNLITSKGWSHRYRKYGLASCSVLSLLKDANLIGVADPNEERGKLAIEQFQCEWFRIIKT